MTKAETMECMTNIMAKFVGYSGEILPGNMTEKLKELRVLEIDELPKTIYGTMLRNQGLAAQLDRPCCQDMGVLQYLMKCDIRFPLIDFVESLLKGATTRATFDAPLRHSGVETSDKHNAGKSMGKGILTVFWEIVPECDTCKIYSYMAGGGYSLPGKAMVLTPGRGYEGVIGFVLDAMTNYGLDTCPPLLMGVGVATSVETAASLSKEALFRALRSKNSNEGAAKLEKLLENDVNEVGLGPQGVSDEMSVMGVHIENTARHPSTVGAAISVGCQSHRKGHIIFDKDLKHTIISHKGVTL